MTHLPYIVAAYGLTALVVGTLVASTWRRLRAARARLATLDPRK